MNVKNRKTLLLWSIVLLLATINFLQLCRNSYHPEIPAVNTAINTEINDKINPNTADWPSLTRLPGIGETRAKDIINYRNNQKKYDNTTTVYQDYMDLAQVKGIGKITCEQIRDYLIFAG